MLQIGSYWQTLIAKSDKIAGFYGADSSIKRAEFRRGVGLAFGDILEPRPVQDAPKYCPDQPVLGEDLESLLNPSLAALKQLVIVEGERLVAKSGRTMGNLWWSDSWSTLGLTSCGIVLPNDGYTVSEKTRFEVEPFSAYMLLTSSTSNLPLLRRNVDTLKALLADPQIHSSENLLQVIGSGLQSLDQAIGNHPLFDEELAYDLLRMGRGYFTFSGMFENGVFRASESSPVAMELNALLCESRSVRYIRDSARLNYDEEYFNNASRFQRTADTIRNLGADASEPSEKRTSIPWLAKIVLKRKIGRWSGRIRDFLDGDSSWNFKDVEEAMEHLVRLAEDHSDIWPDIMPEDFHELRLRLQNRHP